MNTTHVSINHPHARTAVFLASIHPAPRGLVADELRYTGTPRRLYTLARLLRAAQMMDQMDAYDAVNGAHPAIVARDA
ncbi:MAG: hypothetical protein M0Z99_00805 [Betaproteobacteria bacterium]|nr:hypothetical protein [Betaproteobacteria bacterium]